MNSTTVNGPTTTTDSSFSTNSPYEGFSGHSSSPSTDVTQELNQTETTHPPELSVAYTASEVIVALFAIFGNALVVYVFCTNRSLRRYRNYYIFALAIADFLVGLFGIPFAVLASIGLPRNLYGCLFTVSILVVLCTISILCLVAVSIDRYWATTNPFAYYRHMTTSTAVGIILSCWIVGAVIGFLPLFGWYNLEGWYESPGPESCFFTKVMDYNYLVFLYFATIVFPAILMGCFYGYIYHVVLIKIRQKGNLAPQLRRPSEQSRSGSLNSDNRGASQMLRIIVSEKRREAKAAHKLAIIVGFFMICWMPLYTINCIQAFCRDCVVPIEVINFTIMLSHANSSLNPLLYAYHLKEFRIAMKNALLQLFAKIMCGLMGERLQKDDSQVPGPLSRSHTLPSLAHAMMTNNTEGNTGGKNPIRFRRSPRNNDRCVQVSPTHGLVISTLSRDNLNPNATTFTTIEKSATSVSLASDNSSSIIQEMYQQRIQGSMSMEENKLKFSEAMSEEQEINVKCDMSHGIEIHVVNVEGEWGVGGGHSSFRGDEHNTEMEDQSNELDSNRTTDMQMTTPL